MAADGGSGGPAAVFFKDTSSLGMRISIISKAQKRAKYTIDIEENLKKKTNSQKAVQPPLMFNSYLCSLMIGMLTVSFSFLYQMAAEKFTFPQQR